jgi:phosphatidylinositol alpha-1,6-mannosyltransferase
VDAVKEKVTGLIVDGNNTRMIADSICQLLAEPAKAKNMGQSGRNWVLDDWQLSSWSKKFNDLLISD